MKKKRVKRQRNGVWVLFVIFGLAAVVALFMFSKPQLTGNVVREGCDGDWTVTDWGECVDSSQTRTWTLVEGSNSTCESPFTETQSCTLCTESWTCADWTACENETQTRTCTDANSCGTTVTKPAESQSCTLCTENWTCTDWGACADTSTQTRTCTDANTCGTILTKPSESQSCTYTPPCTPDWTNEAWGECIDGVKTRSPTDNNDCDVDYPSSLSAECSEENSQSTTEETTTPTGTGDVIIVTYSVCSPSQESCANGGLYVCNAAGTGWDLKQTCELGCAGNACAVPVQEQAPAETCEDGIKNQDELGIDCGGICTKRCSIFTLAGSVVKGPIESGKQFFTNLFANFSSNKTRMYLILGGVGVLAAGLVSYFVFFKKRLFKKK